MLSALLMAAMMQGGAASNHQSTNSGTLAQQLHRIAVRDSGRYEQYLFDVYHAVRDRIEKSGRQPNVDTLLRLGGTVLDPHDPVAYVLATRNDNLQYVKLPGADHVGSEGGIAVTAVASDPENGWAGTAIDSLNVDLVFHLKAPIADDGTTLTLPKESLLRQSIYRMRLLERKRLVTTATLSYGVSVEAIFSRVVIRTFAFAVRLETTNRDLGGLRTLSYSAECGIDPLTVCPSTEGDGKGRRVGLFGPLNGCQY